MDAEDIQVEDYTHTGCYIFKPKTSQDDEEEQLDEEQRPRKKRRTLQPPTDAHGKQDDHAWPSLLAGNEPPSSIRLRQQIFRTLWTQYQLKIDEIINQPDDQFVCQVLNYIRGEPSSGDRLRTGLIVSGATKNAQRDLASVWKRTQSQDDKDLLIPLRPSLSPNLQTTLKNIIRLAISDYGGPDAYSSFLTSQKSLIPMNFDLELLQRYVKRHSISRIVVSILDVETFDTAVVSELILTMKSWAQRIPFVLLVDISTTVELFESRLSKSTCAALDAKIFEVAEHKVDPFYEIYRTVQHGYDTDVFLGPAVVSVFSDLAQDQTTTISVFVRAIRYSFMTHFFANALSILTSNSTLGASESKSLCQAIRNTRQFQKRCESLLNDTGQLSMIKDLLKSDETLLSDSTTTVEKNKVDLRSLLQAVNSLHMIYDLLPLPAMPPLELETQLMTSLPDLQKCNIYLDIESALETLTSEQYHQFIATLCPLAKNTNLFTFETTDPLDPKQLVSLPMLQSSMSDHSISTNSSSTFNHLLRSYLTQTANGKPNPWTTHLCAANIINTRSPLSSILQARPRFSLERALTRPSDYLGCSCCSSQSDHQTKHNDNRISLRSDLPPTSLLLTLLNEAGNIVNVRDLWDAFRRSSSPSTANHSIDHEEEAEDEDEEDESDAPLATAESTTNGNVITTSSKGDKEREALALFYRGLAELRHLGFVKSSKRKPGVDCIARTAWMGL